MKHIIMVFTVVVCLAIPTIAVEKTFQWDPAPSGQEWTEVRLYEKDGSNYTLLGFVPGDRTQITIDIPAAAKSYIVRSYSDFYDQESADSNIVTTPAPPTPPSGFNLLRIVIAAIGGIAVGFLFIFRLFGKIF